jgi:hypothetical protein
VETDAAFGRFRFEIGRSVANSQGHELSSVIVAMRHVPCVAICEQQVKI